MGIQTQEDLTLGSLSAAYAAFYKEFQVRNFTHVDIVITEEGGLQHFLPPATNAIRENEAQVEIQTRAHNGTRAEMTQFGMKEIKIKGSITSIPFDQIRNAPYYDPKHRIVISTVDHSLVAQELIKQSLYNPLIYETSVDETILDPRLVFQVIDPNNRWSELYVNVFGQTMIIRAGHWADVLPFPSLSDGQDHSGEPAKLICYLRYPYDYASTVRTVSTVFEISLDNIDKNEPIQIGNGDVICVAPTMEELQIALAKKASGSRGDPTISLTDKMVPKTMYDAAVANHKAEIEQMKAEYKTQMETAKINADNAIAKVRQDLENERQARATAEAQLKHWEGINKARASIDEIAAERDEAQAKARKATSEAEQKEIDNMWNTVKICGAAVATVITFAITIYLKTNKR